MGLLEKIQASTCLHRKPWNSFNSAVSNTDPELLAELEISRLEKRYTRSRAKRSTWISDAHYVDGEYVYWSNDISPVSSRTVDNKWPSIRAKPLKKRESFLA